MVSDQRTDSATDGSAQIRRGQQIHPNPKIAMPWLFELLAGQPEQLHHQDRLHHLDSRLANEGGTCYVHSIFSQPLHQPSQRPSPIPNPTFSTTVLYPYLQLLHLVRLSLTFYLLLDVQCTLYIPFFATLPI